MAFRCFVLSIHDSGPATEELNAFLRSHTVLSVERRWVEQGSASFWSFCVDYHDRGSVASAVAPSRFPGSRPRVDYKETLQPQEFVVFARLRELRKELAQAEGVPVNTLFSNEQLAQMVQTQVTTKAALQKIEGVGEAKVEKYGERFLKVLSSQGSNGHEAGRQPV